MLYARIAGINGEHKSIYIFNTFCYNVINEEAFLANEKNLENGKPYQFRSGEMAAKNGAKGGKARAAKKTVAEYLRNWADGEVSGKDKEALKALGLDEEATNRTLLVVPLIKKASSGDTKALQMALELLGEDKKKDLEIKKLQQEIELLKAETQRLKMQAGEDRDVEDLSALGDMLKDESDTNN